MAKKYMAMPGRTQYKPYILDLVSPLILLSSRIPDYKIVSSSYNLYNVLFTLMALQIRIINYIWQQCHVLLKHISKTGI
jgi:hypothetical protein